MRKMNNKGFSMVEILISITIFAVLMIPIVGAIISSLKNTTEAKTLQYRNEFVENVVEYVKQDSLKSVFAGNYFKSVGSYTDGGSPISVSGTFYKDPSKSYDESLQPIADYLGSSVNKNGKSEVTSGDDLSKTYYPYEEYEISGKVDLGPKDTTYAYKMLISNKYYADKEKDGTYVNPNNLALGVVEDIDYTKVALINGTIANYDESVANAFLTKKISLMKDISPTWYDIFVSHKDDAELFSSDVGTRLIAVKVSGSESTGYKVVGTLTYGDDGASFDTFQITGNDEHNTKCANAKTQFQSEYITYEPFEFNYPVGADGKAKLPNIYLMYNPCLYNGMFTSKDYIAIDTTGLATGDPAKVNLFIVETAETYSDNLTSANSSLTKSKKLYNYAGRKSGGQREDVTVYIGAITGSKLNNVSVYHNFGSTDINKTNAKIAYANTNFTSLTVLGKTCKPLIVDGDSTNSVANFGGLNQAKQESRGLYDVKVYMVEGDDPSVINTATDTPIMTATKGGNES